MASAASTSEKRRCTRPGCPNFLSGHQRLYCSNSCRAIASNMRKGAENRALAESMALESIREKIEPVTRELLTDKVLTELKALTDLLPFAVAELRRELAVDEKGNPLVEDADIRHKAAMQLFKWTVGNSSVAPPSLEQQPAPLQVVISSDIRQSSTPGEAVEDDPEDLRECLECHLLKAPSEFVGQSNRCKACHQKMLDSVTERYGSAVLGSDHASS